MKPADQPQATPFTGEGCGALPVVRGQDSAGPVLVSAWELSADEVVDVLKTGRIWLIIRGTAHPPVSIVTRAPYDLPEGSADGGA
jgi:hypothetical protein